MDETITINGIEYVKKDSIKSAAKVDGMDYKIIRCEKAGVFAGFIADRDGRYVVIKNARRLWYWKGAASLSQLAIDGVNCPNDCKFPEAVSSITVTDCIEILDVTEKAKNSIEGVKIWRA